MTRNNYLHRTIVLWVVNGLALVALIACAALAAPLPKTAPSSHKTMLASQDTVTWTRNIAPMIFQNCSSCHHPGEVAPFSLLTYRDVQKRAKQIAMVTQSRTMPPWRPEHGYGEFQHERRLTQSQIALLEQWVDEGAPEGNLADLPPAPQFTDGWELGKPDLILKMVKPITIPADGQDVNRSFPVSVHLPAGCYIRAAQFLPGNRRIVHHGTAMMDSSGKARQLEDQQGGPGSGYVSFGGPGFLPSGGLPGYAPGFGAEVYPPDASGTLPKDVDVVFGMHYHPDGKEETDQSSIGLYFTDRPPTRIGSLVTMGVLNLAIAPGDKTHLEQDTYTLPVDVDVDGIYEHMHLLGKTCKLWAELPDHTVRPLIKINDWDFSWQATYHLKNRMHLPRGTVIHAQWTYDNSADNPHQFNYPPKEITNGENSTNEMGGVLINVYVASPQDNGIIWIANLGHLWQASVKPPAHHASRQEPSSPHGASVGLVLMDSIISGVTNLLVSLLRAPGRTFGVLLLLMFAANFLFLLAPGYFSRFAVSQASDALAASPWRCFGIGFLAASLLLTQSLLISPSALVQVFALLLWAGAFAAWSVGMGALPHWIGRRLFRQAGWDISPAILTKSSLLIAIALAFPVIGGLILAPVAALLSLGAGLCAIRVKCPAWRPFGRTLWFDAQWIMPRRNLCLATILLPLCLLLLGNIAFGAAANPDPLTAAKGKKAVVLLFIASDCPISNSYAPEINRICARYTREKIAFSLVYSDPDLSIAAAKKHAADYGFTCPFVLDPSRRLAHRVGATVTPEAAVFAPNGKILYRGRIDNLYIGFGQRRYGATKHDLRDALDAIVQGKPISSPRTPAIGCFI